MVRMVAIDVILMKALEDILVKADTHGETKVVMLVVSGVFLLMVLDEMVMGVSIVVVRIIVISATVILLVVVA